MEENEDEPDDVRNATPVSDDIKSGERDEKTGKQKASGNKKDSGEGGKKTSRCEKDDKPVLVKLEGSKCCAKIAKPSSAPKTMSVMIYSPPCSLPRLEIIPRHCLSKKEYIDILATPSRKCPTSCLGKTVIRKVRPMSARINELAQPARRLIVGTLQERGETLPPEMISNLVKSIEGSTCLTPEQAEQYFKDKERAKERKSGKCPKQRRCKEKVKSPCPSGLDKEAVMCQYLMAERFVKSILQWKCPIPVEEFQDIASVILRRLSFVLEYTPLGEQEDLKSQQMRFLADIVACWISGVLFEVAEEHMKELKEEKLYTDEIESEEETDEDDEGPTTFGLEPGEEEEEEEEEEEIREEKQAENKDKDKGIPEDKRGDGKKKPETEKQPTEPPKTDTRAPDDASNEPSGPPVVTLKPEPSEPTDATAQQGEDLANRDEERKEAEEKARKEAEQRARKEAEEKARKETEENARKEAEEKARKEADEEARKEAEEKARKEAEEKARLEEEKRKQEEAEKKARLEAEKEEEEKKKKKEMEEAAEKARLEEEEKKRKQREAEEEAEEKRRKEAEEKRKEEEKEEEEKRRKEAEEKKKKKKEEDKLMELGPVKTIDEIGEGKLFKTDLPFVTFGKILDTIYDMLADEPEGDETDVVHNRIQRALYEKLSRLVESETPDVLTENLKDVIDVTSGKMASWLKNVLKDSEAKFMAAQPPEVESKEIRNWGRWIDQVTDRAVDWADWIHRVVKEAEGKSKEPVNRGDWQNWTGDTDTNALLWRRYYLETVHQAHHNKMMMVDRPVVKTGQKGAHLTAANAAEEEIRNTDLVA